MSDEDGVALVLVAILLVMLLALVGLAVDLGRVYQERRELRNGADAAALAIAADCGLGVKPCDDATAEATAQWYINANTEDGFSAVDQVDLNPPLPNPYQRGVRVVAASEDSEVDVPFIRAATAGAIAEITVTAPATAIYDWPKWMWTFPLLVEACEWENHPPDGNTPGAETYIYVHAGGSPEGVVECTERPAFQDAPGAFGWMRTDGPCQAEVVAHNPQEPPVFEQPPYPHPGNQRPPCDEDQMIAIRDNTITVPLYGAVEGQGDNTTYWVVGFASFHVTGYRFNGPPDIYRWPAGFSCPEGPGASQECIRGYFTTGITAYAEPGGANYDFGMILVRLVE